MTLYGEVGAAGKGYEEVYEAVSNEYDSGVKLGKKDPGNFVCFGNCNKRAQLLWMLDMEAFRQENIVDYFAKIGWEMHIDLAKQIATEGYVNGINDSWFFGNIFESQRGNYRITSELPGYYRNRIFITYK
jgi:hypothetical protein